MSNSKLAVAGAAVAVAVGAWLYMRREEATEPTLQPKKPAKEPIKPAKEPINPVKGPIKPAQEPKQPAVETPREPAKVMDEDAVATLLTESALRVIEVDGLDRCYVARRALEPGEMVIRERPLLQTGDADSSNRTEVCLRAYCGASKAVQAKVLTMCSPLTELESSTDSSFTHMRELLIEVEAFASEPWAQGISLEELKKAMLIFNLNSHAYAGKSCALFERGCIFAHACEPNTKYVRSRTHGCHIVLRPIAEGELVTTNYIGVDALISRPMRQALLHVTKLFVCGCARCAGPDYLRAVPCPGCHPRQGDGSLPAAPAGKSLAEFGHSHAYIVPRPKGGAEKGGAWTGGKLTNAFEWPCAKCGRCWSDREVQSAGGKEGGEFKLSNAAYRYTREAAQLIGPTGAALVDAEKLTELRKLYSNVASVLGTRHWATMRQAGLLVKVLGDALQSRPQLDAIGLSTAEAAAGLAELSAVCWRACAAGFAHISLFHGVFPDAALLGILNSADAAHQLQPHVLQELLLRGLACAACDWSARSSIDGTIDGTEPASDSQLSAVCAAIEAKTGLASTGPAAAETLRERGNAAFKAGENAEALLWYLSALNLAPRESALHSNMAMCYRKLSMYTEAAAAARHCIRLAPEWPKGHHHLAQALLAAGERAEAESAAERAASLTDPSDERAHNAALKLLHAVRAGK